MLLYIINCFDLMIYFMFFFGGQNTSCRMLVGMLVGRVIKGYNCF